VIDMERRAHRFAGRASDAVVLFEGKDLSKWAQKDGSAADGKSRTAYAEVTVKSGYIYTREGFGDCQLARPNFSEPSLRKGESQDRGNSGVFLMGLYEFKCSIPTKTKPTLTAKPRPCTANIHR